MTDDVQPGVRIDPQLWEEFRRDVKARNGAVRGHLQTELENAIRQYLGRGVEPLGEDIDGRLSRIETELGIASTDGGTHTQQAETHTRAPSVTDKPSANEATEKKVAYLAGCVLDDVAPSGGDVHEIPKTKLRDVVKDEYGFRKDTARRYVEELIDYFDFQNAPQWDGMLVSDERYEELVEERREQATEDADEQLENL